MRVNRDLHTPNSSLQIAVFCLLLVGGGGGLCGGCGDDDASTDTPVVYSDWPEARELNPATVPFPAWSFGMRLWAFDVLTSEMTHAEIEQRLDAATDAQANTVIFYIESEHMYRTFVDQAGGL